MLVGREVERFKSLGVLVGLESSGGKAIHDDKHLIMFVHIIATIVVQHCHTMSHTLSGPLNTLGSM